MIMILRIIISNKRIWHFPMVFMWPLLLTNIQASWNYFRENTLIKGFCHGKRMITWYLGNIQMCMESSIWIGDPIHLSRMKNSLYSNIIFRMKFGNQTCWSDFVAKSGMLYFMILYPFTIMSIIFQNFRLEFMKIFISVRGNITVKLWFEMKTQVIFIE